MLAERLCGSAERPNLATGTSSDCAAIPVVVACGVGNSVGSRLTPPRGPHTDHVLLNLSVFQRMLCPESVTCPVPSRWRQAGRDSAHITARESEQAITLLSRLVPICLAHTHRHAQTVPQLGAW